MHVYLIFAFNVLLCYCSNFAKLLNNLFTLKKKPQFLRRPVTDNWLYIVMNGQKEKQLVRFAVCSYACKFNL
jgi:hypothetical protein